MRRCEFDRSFPDIVKTHFEYSEVIASPWMDPDGHGC